jgi:hypothetical protein
MFVNLFFKPSQATNLLLPWWKITNFNHVIVRM